MRRLVAAFLLMALAFGARAQFPSQTVKIVVAQKAPVRLSSRTGASIQLSAKKRSTTSPVSSENPA